MDKMRLPIEVTGNHVLPALAVAVALIHPSAAFSSNIAPWLSQRPAGLPLHALEAARSRRASGRAALPAVSSLRLGRMVVGDVDPGVSASRDFDTLTRQIPSKPIDSGMNPPSEAQLFEKFKGDAIPWVITVLLTLPVMVISRSLYPAIVVALLDLAWFVYSWVQAKEMNTPAKPEPVSRDLLELWDKCLTESPDGPEDFVTGWFYDAPLASIAREDVYDWLAWGCFCTTWDKLVPESRAEAMLVFEMIEERLNHRFPERRPGEEAVPCMRFTIEPIEWTHKPFLFYAVCQGLLGGLGTVSLWNEGFTRHRSGVFDYWVRMPETEEGRQRTPVVFVHGIGVGLVMYLNLIKSLMTFDCPIICVELPFISSNIAPKVPSISEQVSSMESICNRWGFRQAMFVGHSYGSVMLSWMAQHLPSRVAGLVFVDPVVMMLNLKSILYNFLYRHEGDGKISDLIGTELHINNALRRNFWWYRNIVWAGDLQRQRLPSLVCLSEKDEIVPSNAVERHIQKHAKKAGDSNLVESYMMPGANHGEMLFDQDTMDGLLARIQEHYTKVEQLRGSGELESYGVRYPRSLGNVFGAWEAAVQLRWSARRLSAGTRGAIFKTLDASKPVWEFVKQRLAGASV